VSLSQTTTTGTHKERATLIDQQHTITATNTSATDTRHSELIDCEQTVDATNGSARDYVSHSPTANISTADTYSGAVPAIVPALHELTPSGERRKTGPDADQTESELFDRAREAVAVLRGRGRRANGQAAPCNTLSLKTGLRSQQLLEQSDVAAWHREEVATIAADLGGADTLSAIKTRLVGELARVTLIAASLGDNVLTLGPLTGKGKTRAATLTYLQVLDRQVRLSQLLGLDRVARNVGESIEAQLAREPEAR
jgi:hypothetical protein